MTNSKKRLSLVIDPFHSFCKSGQFGSLNFRIDYFKQNYNQPKKDLSNKNINNKDEKVCFVKHDESESNFESGNVLHDKASVPKSVNRHSSTEWRRISPWHQIPLVQYYSKSSSFSGILNVINENPKLVSLLTASSKSNSSSFSNRLSPLLSEYSSSSSSQAGNFEDGLSLNKKENNYEEDNVLVNYDDDCYNDNIKDNFSNNNNFLPFIWSELINDCLRDDDNDDNHHHDNNSTTRHSVILTDDGFIDRKKNFMTRINNINSSTLTKPSSTSSSFLQTPSLLPSSSLASVNAPALFLSMPNIFLNMIVEIPKFEKYKMEIATATEWNPISHDIKKGKPRISSPPLYWNYGALPQTWENPLIRG